MNEMKTTMNQMMNKMKDQRMNEEREDEEKMTRNCKIEIDVQESDSNDDSSDE